MRKQEGSYAAAVAEIEGIVARMESGDLDVDDLLESVKRASKLIGECPCADGCPSCVQSPKCGNLNEPLHKQGALELMTAMLAWLGQPETANIKGPAVR